MSNTFLIGDIHGCFEDFQRLLNQMPIQANDKIILLGDLCSKGPDGIALLHWLISQHHVESIIGNHDLLLLHDLLVKPQFNSPAWLDQLKTTKQFDEMIDWLRSQSFMHQLDNQHCLVHAGLFCDWDDATLSEIEHHSKTLINPKFIKKHYEVMLDHLAPNKADPHFWINVLVNIRYIDKNTKRLLKDFNAPEHRTHPESMPWFEAPTAYNQNLNVYFGHWSLLKEVQYGRFWCLDGGCVYGNQLIGLKLDDHTIYSVPSSIQKD